MTKSSLQMLPITCVSKVMKKNTLLEVLSKAWHRSYSLPGFLQSKCWSACHAENLGLIGLMISVSGHNRDYSPHHGNNLCSRKFIPRRIGISAATTQQDSRQAQKKENKAEKRHHPPKQRDYSTAQIIWVNQLPALVWAIYVIP